MIYLFVIERLGTVMKWKSSDSDRRQATCEQNNLERKEQVRKGGLPPLFPNQLDWGKRG